MSLPRPCELVVFDVDGTLQNTFQWWPRVLRAGIARFAAQCGVVIDPPNDAAACAVVGLRDAQVWGPFLPESLRHRWEDLRQTVVPLEVEELSAGRDYLFPGVRDLLGHLRHLGVKIALASNCRSGYFAAVCDGQGLGALSDWQFCLDSRGGCSKSDMVRFALEAAGAPAGAVMVGDRDSDQEAATAAGVPFVWRVNDRMALPAPPDARWHGDPGELLHLLGLPRIS
ncbi:MAG: HAD family hydrolase [Planctomycetota bacterium]